MESSLDLVKRAKIGAVIPIYKVIDGSIDSVEYFSKLSDYGRKKHCMLLESADIVEKYGELSIGTACPSLHIVGRGENFEIKALNELGRRIIRHIKGDFGFCDKVTIKPDSIKGVLNPGRKSVDEEARLSLKTHMDIIRAVAFKFKPESKPFVPYCGLFGSISYDFIDQFEDLPKNRNDVLKEPDYELYFADNLFMIDHKKKKMYLVANALVMDNNRVEEYDRCIKIIEGFERSLKDKLPKLVKFKLKNHVIESDTSQADYEGIVEKLKRNIDDGDIFQVVPSRTIISNYNSEPLDIYKKLRELNPSPYMFYINNSNGILLGASPEMFLRVQGDKEKVVEIRPIAGTKPRGIIDDKIDSDLDSRYEAELKIDPKEIAEHTMLIDLARNDVARISKPGTRFVDEPYIVEKYSHVQHLVSNVKGILKDEFDALHAYLASMNMGTLTGAPKVKAMELLRKVENNKRGFYGGAVGYITPSKDFDSTIVIRSMRLKDNKAYIRVGAGVVYDSIPLQEFLETEKKSMACIKAIKLAGGLK